jgi:hypothetical protein
MNTPSQSLLTTDDEIHTFYETSVGNDAKSEEILIRLAETISGFEIGHEPEERAQVLFVLIYSVSDKVYQKMLMDAEKRYMFLYLYVINGPYKNYDALLQKIINQQKSLAEHENFQREMFSSLSPEIRNGLINLAKRIGVREVIFSEEEPDDNGLGRFLMEHIHESNNVRALVTYRDQNKLIEGVDYRSVEEMPDLQDETLARKKFEEHVSQIIGWSNGKKFITFNEFGNALTEEQIRLVPEELQCW